MTIVRKYVGSQEQMSNIINRFLKKIIIHTPDASSDRRRQKIEQAWNFIKEINLPDDDQTVER